MSTVAWLLHPGLAHHAEPAQLTADRRTDQAADAEPRQRANCTTARAWSEDPLIGKPHISVDRVQRFLRATRYL